MILRRFMHHIRDQNWFAVGLDVLVVIVGIFLGLQVQAYYEKRQALEQEVRTVEYFIADLEKNIAVLEDRKLYMDNQIEKGHIVLEILAGDQLNEGDKADFEAGIILVGRNEPLTSFLSSLNEQNLEKILDIELRRILDGFAGYLNRTSSVEENIKSNMQGVMPFINRRSGFTGNASSGFTGSSNRPGIAIYDFDVLKNDPDFQASFANVQGKTINFREMLITMIDQSQKMIDILKQYQAGEELAEVEFQ